MTWLEPGLPNSLAPGRRPRTTLTPSIALRDGVPVLAFGTPGGDQQDQWQLHFFLAVATRAKARGGLDLQGAIDAPNWHNDSFPGSFYPRGMRPGSVTVESRMDEAVVAELRRRGHDVTVGDAWSEGRLCAVARDPEAGILSAAANPRGCRGTPWAAEPPAADPGTPGPGDLQRRVFMVNPPGVHRASGDCQ